MTLFNNFAPGLGVLRLLVVFAPFGRLRSPQIPLFHGRAPLGCSQEVPETLRRSQEMLGRSQEEVPGCSQEVPGCS